MVKTAVCVYTQCITFAEYLLTEAEIAIVPGSAFGADGCIRISYATDLATLEKAIKRLQKVCA